jgi:hypothetical protein
VVEEGVGGGIWCKYCVHRYVNAKMTPVETVPRMGGRGMKESSGGGNPGMIYLIHCKNLSKCYNVPPLSTTTTVIVKRRVHCPGWPGTTSVFYHSHLCIFFLAGCGGSHL